MKYSFLLAGMLTGTALAASQPADAQTVTPLIDQFKLETLTRHSGNSISSTLPVSKDRKANLSVQFVTEAANPPEDNLRRALKGPLGDNGKYKISAGKVTVRLAF